MTRRHRYLIVLGLVSVHSVDDVVDNSNSYYMMKMMMIPIVMTLVGIVTDVSDVQL